MPAENALDNSWLRRDYYEVVREGKRVGAWEQQSIDRNEHQLFCCLSPDNGVMCHVVSEHPTDYVWIKNPRGEPKLAGFAPFDVHAVCREVIQRCPYHASIADPQTLFDTLHDVECRLLKRYTIALLEDDAIGMDYPRPDGTIARWFRPGLKRRWHFNPARELQVTVDGADGRQRAKATVIATRSEFAGRVAFRETLPRNMALAPQEGRRP